MEADTDRDGKISFEEFTKMVENTDVSMSMTLGRYLSILVHALNAYALPRVFIPGSVASTADIATDQF